MAWNKATRRTWLRYLVAVLIVGVASAVRAAFLEGQAAGTNKWSIVKKRRSRLIGPMSLDSCHNTLTIFRSCCLNVSLYLRSYQVLKFYKV